MEDQLLIMNNHKIQLKVVRSLKEENIIIKIASFSELSNYTHISMELF